MYGQREGPEGYAIPSLPLPWDTQRSGIPGLHTALQHTADGSTWCHCCFGHSGTQQLGADPRPLQVLCT